MEGYGNDQTASSSDQGGSNIASAIAQIFATGVTAYVDSQAIQRGYQINDPRYYQAGYPAGVSLPYGYQQQGASVAVSSNSNNGSMLLLLIVAVVAVALLK